MTPSALEPFPGNVATNGLRTASALHSPGMTDHVARLDGLNLVLPFSRPVTAEEWNGIQWPPCPKCGTTVLVDRADVTTVGDLLRQYVAGRW